MYMLRSIQVDEHKLHVYRHMYNVNVSMYIGNYTNVHVPVHVMYNCTLLLSYMYITYTVP